MLTDPIADFLTRIRNALNVHHNRVDLPTSKRKVDVAQILKQEGFIRDYELLKAKPQGILRLHLAYRGNQEPILRGLKRISKPSLRVYVGKGEVPRIYGGLGIAILSTSKGIITGKEAWRRQVGGELLCYVW